MVLRVSLPLVQPKNVVVLSCYLAGSSLYVIPDFLIHLRIPHTVTVDTKEMDEQDTLCSILFPHEGQKTFSILEVVL